MPMIKIYTREQLEQCERCRLVDIMLDISAFTKVAMTDMISGLIPFSEICSETLIDSILNFQSNILKHPESVWVCK